MLPMRLKILVIHVIVVVVTVRMVSMLCSVLMHLLGTRSKLIMGSVGTHRHYSCISMMFAIS